MSGTKSCKFDVTIVGEKKKNHSDVDYSDHSDYSGDDDGDDGNDRNRKKIIITTVEIEKQKQKKNMNWSKRIEEIIRSIIILAIMKKISNRPKTPPPRLNE